MIDWSKPLQTRSGAEAVFIAGPLDPTTAKLILGPRAFLGHETHFVRIGSDLYGYDETGSYYGTRHESVRDLINSPVKTVEYRTFAYKDRLGFGAIAFPTLKRATDLAKLDAGSWEGVVRMVKLNGELTSMRYFPLDDGEKQ